MILIINKFSTLQVRSPAISQSITSTPASVPPDTPINNNRDQDSYSVKKQPQTPLTAAKTLISSTGKYF